MFENAPFLLVEDQEHDIRLIARAFIKAKILNPLQVARTGAEAIAYLRGADQYADRDRYPLPSLALLDIKLPGADGFDVLTWIRGEAAVQALRVVMLTSSDEMRDVTRAYELGANSYLIKPVDFERFVEFSQALAGYWSWSATAGGKAATMASQTAGEEEILKRPPLARRFKI